MDIAALGSPPPPRFPAHSATQQAALSGIKSAQVQAQSLISMLTRRPAARPRSPRSRSAAPAAPTDGAGADARLPRGSIVNILA